MHIQIFHVQLHVQLHGRSPIHAKFNKLEIVRFLVAAT